MSLCICVIYPVSVQSEHVAVYMCYLPVNVQSEHVAVYVFFQTVSDCLCKIRPCYMEMVVVSFVILTFERQTSISPLTQKTGQ